MKVIDKGRGRNRREGGKNSWTRGSKRLRRGGIVTNEEIEGGLRIKEKGIGGGRKEGQEWTIKGRVETGGMERRYKVRLTVLGRLLAHNRK